MQRAPFRSAVREQLPRLLIRHADAEEFERDLMRVDVGTKVLLHDAELRGARNRFAPVALRLHHGVAQLARTIVVFLCERQEEAAAPLVPAPESSSIQRVQCSKSA